MHDICSMTRSKVKVTNPSKLETRPFLKASSSAIYNGSQQLTISSTRERPSLYSAISTFYLIHKHGDYYSLYIYIS